MFWWRNFFCHERRGTTGVSHMPESFCIVENMPCVLWCAIPFVKIAPWDYNRLLWNFQPCQSSFHFLSYFLGATSCPFVWFITEISNSPTRTIFFFGWLRAWMVIEKSHIQLSVGIIVNQSHQLKTINSQRVK